MKSKPPIGEMWKSERRGVGLSRPSRREGVVGSPEEAEMMSFPEMMPFFCWSCGLSLSFVL